MTQSNPTSPTTPPPIHATLHFDGSCRPNPGPSKCGFSLKITSPPDRRRKIERSLRLGPGTNNTAEYNGLIEGMREALKHGVTHLDVYGDSQIVITSVNSRRWDRGGDQLRLYRKTAILLVRQFRVVTLRWVPREQNGRADKLSNR